MANGPMSKGASPTNDPMPNVLELPEASNADMGVVTAVVAADEADVEAPRGETPNNQLMILNLFPTTHVRIAIQTLPAPHMVQQHHYCCL